MIKEKILTAKLSTLLLYFGGGCLLVVAFISAVLLVVAAFQQHPFFGFFIAVFVVGLPCFLLGMLMEDF